MPSILVSHFSGEKVNNEAENLTTSNPYVLLTAAILFKFETPFDSLDVKVMY